MAISKAERLLDLVIALLNARYYRTAEWIHRHVAGYDDVATDEAFSRMFERDKQELRDLGIPIETQSDGDGYRIEPGEFALPDMTFTPAESTALALAARLWENTSLRDAGSAALRKLRDAGGGDDAEAATGDAARADTAHAAPGRIDTADGTDAADGTDTAAGTDATTHPAHTSDTPDIDHAVQARLRTADPSFVDLVAAVRSRRVVRFDYRPAGSTAPARRTIEPWGLVNYRGQWYVVGRDRDRNAPRTFRLSRIVGNATPFGRAGAFDVPDDVTLKDYVEPESSDGITAMALLRIRPRRAAGLRRGGELLHATVDPDGFDEVRVPIRHLTDLARRVAGHGSDVMVVDPPELREMVIELLRGALRNATRAATDAPADTADTVTEAHR